MILAADSDDRRAPLGGPAAQASGRRGTRARAAGPWADCCWPAGADERAWQRPPGQNVGLQVAGRVPALYYDRHQHSSSSSSCRTHQFLPCIATSIRVRPSRATVAGTSPKARHSPRSRPPKRANQPAAPAPSHLSESHPSPSRVRPRPPACVARAEAPDSDTGRLEARGGGISGCRLGGSTDRAHVRSTARQPPAQIRVLQAAPPPVARPRLECGHWRHRPTLERPLRESRSESRGAVTVRVTWSCHGPRRSAVTVRVTWRCRGPSRGAVTVLVVALCRCPSRGAKASNRPSRNEAPSTLSLILMLSLTLVCVRER